MGTPGREDDDDDHVVRVGIGGDDNDSEEEDPEEEEEFDEDPEEEEEVAGGEESENSVEDGVDGGEDLQVDEEVDGLEEFEEEEEVIEEVEEVELELELENNEEDVENGDEVEDDEEEVELDMENNEEDVGNGDEVEEDEDEEEDEVEMENSEADVENDDEVEEDEVERENKEEKLGNGDEVEEDEVEMENSEADVENDDEVEEDEVERENKEAKLGNGDEVKEDEDEEEDEVEMENSEADVENDDEVEEDEVELENKEEKLGNGDEVEEDDKPSIPPIISSEKDVTDILPGKRQNVFKGDTDGPDNESEDGGDIKPLIFATAEPLKNENVGCGHEAEGVNELNSECGEKETSQHFNVKDAKDIDFRAMRGESRGFEATESLNTDTSISVDSGVNKYNPVDHGSDGDTVMGIKSDVEREIYQHISSKAAEDIDVCAHHSEPKGIEAAEFLSTGPPSPIFVEAEPLRNENGDPASECMGVTRTGSDCEEKERHINNKVAQPVDVYTPSNELNCTSETAKPLSAAGLDLEMDFMQEGGVEDMDLDSEENIVHGSDFNGTVANSIQENLALSSHHKASFSDVANASDNKTVVPGNVMSSGSGGKDLKEHTSLEPLSLAATSGKERSLPPVTQLTDRNKRPAIMCSYYAKGWCIKGNSCRFLHVKENKDNTDKQQVRDLASAYGEKQVSEGSGDSSKIIFPEQHAESHMHQLNNKPGFGFGVVASSSAFAWQSMPPNVNATLFNDPLQSIANRYINQHLHPAAPTDVYSSRYISAINGSSNSVVALNSNPYDALKISSGSIAFNASSSSLGLKSQRDRLNSLGLAPKAEKYKWEPSKPFRPSYYFSIPSGSSSPGSMYDPLRDSIEHTSLGIGSFRAEVINYSSNQSYPDSGGNNFEMDGYHGTVPDRYDHSRVTGRPVTEVEAAESSVADQGNLGSARGGDKGSGTTHGKDRSDTNKTNTVFAEKKSKMHEEKIHSNGVDVDTGLATDDLRESKSFRQFRVALIDFTKILLKPAWRMGKISKDAHNLIVKKTVTKVLSGLHSHQIPSTPDLVQQYLSESQPKITKLLEAYVQKHNKT